MSSQNKDGFRCEHCQTNVPNAFVCPNCGKTHSDEWIANNNHATNFASTSLSIYFFIVCPVLYYIVWPFESFESFLWAIGYGCIGFVIAMIAAHNIVKKDPDAIENVRKARLAQYGQLK